MARPGRVLAVQGDARGDLAWVLENPDGVVQVFRRRRTGLAQPDPEPVDAGPGVDPRSLAADASGVVWLRGGEVRYSPWWD